VKRLDEDDVARALDAARAVAIPHNREIIHIIQRGFSVDGQDGVTVPLGMHGYRLEVEAHIITAAQATVENLRQCVGAAGVEVLQFILNPLASGEVVLSDTERQMGVAVCDIVVEQLTWPFMWMDTSGTQWFWQWVATILPMILRPACVFHSPRPRRSRRKTAYALKSGVGAEEYFNVRAFGEDAPVQISRQDLAHIIEARVEEVFVLTLQRNKALRV